MLTVLNKENQIARSFRLGIGLIEGYEEGRTLHKPEEVGEIVARWLLEQRKCGRIYLPGSITKSKMYYYGRTSGSLIVEPVVFYDGEVSPEYNAQLTDEEVISTLQELAELLSTKLGQKRIYLRYNGVFRILQR
ncbi:MAG TPA: hypothetical protein VNF51_00575 [Candidatus Paceibacterota bacterium]|nr:hypothetical protein [Candidatus Paceibacterota bacterium]